MSEHPAVAYLRNAHERAEQLARAAMTPGDFYPSDPIEWIIANNDLSTRETAAAEAHIRANPPDTVLSRVTAERAILAEHAIDEGKYCRRCAQWLNIPIGQQREADDAVDYPCRTVRLLAAGWGWTGDSQA